jgi:CRP/FNR family transcriptional regulator, cyclic AMP receptor protein
MKGESPFAPRCLRVLRNSSLFSGLADADLRVMLEMYGREVWPKGAQLPSGQSSRHFNLIISGRVELTRINPETGRQVTLFTLGPGDGFDVITLLDQNEHEIHPVALDDLELLSAPIEKVRLWVRTHPAFNQALLPYLGGKIRELEALSGDLALFDTMHRLAQLILHQATPNPSLDEAGRTLPPLINTLSDEAMARMIGSVRVVVNRHLQDFAARGLITKKRGHLVVRDLEKLRAYCGELLDK